MKRAAMATTVLAVSLAGLLSISGCDAAADKWCIEGPTMTWADACLTACDTPALYNLCQETLLQAPDAAAEATAYALAAARRAMASLDATAAGGSWGWEREACWRCVDDYLEARSRMAVVVGDLAGGCAVGQTRAEYVHFVAFVLSQMSLGSCLVEPYEYDGPVVPGGCCSELLLSL